MYGNIETKAYFKQNILPTMYTKILFIRVDAVLALILKQLFGQKKLPVHHLLCGS
jgi:hypothetical protein